MTGSPASTSGLPFFLPTSSGQCFCIYYAPPAAVALRGAILYAHPFGEEMNRSRRIAAVQARAFAAAGLAVLQIDLHGCGDSSGDFAEARWQTWKDDLALAHGWLAANAPSPVSLWGLRLGALLMLDYARHAALPVERFVLWQPVLNGQAWLTQWLRLRFAIHMLDGESGNNHVHGTQALRAELAQGQSVEVAGYELSPALACAIDAVDATTLAPAGGEVDWFDIAGNADKPPSPATAKIITAWQRQSIEVRHHQVVGQAFWALPEITECQALADATLAVFPAQMS